MYKYDRGHARLCLSELAGADRVICSGTKGFCRASEPVAFAGRLLCGVLPSLDQSRSRDSVAAVQRSHRVTRF